MRILIVANGELTDAGSLTAKLMSFDHVIAADGGFRHCRSLGIQPDVVIGDLDSLSPEEHRSIEASPSQIRRTSAEKDQTDLELALLHAVEMGAAQLVVIAALGGRIDMTLANLALLGHPGLRTTAIEFWHNRQVVSLIRPPGGELHGEPGDTLSLLPFHGLAQGVSTDGLAYALRDEDLPFGPARGVSNVLEGETASVRLAGGALLAVLTPGRA